MAVLGLCSLAGADNVSGRRVIHVGSYILRKVKQMYEAEPQVEVNDIDGVKIDFPDKWVHLRKSNTEPIIRVYSEAESEQAADEIGKKVMDVVLSMK